MPATQKAPKLDDKLILAKASKAAAGKLGITLSELSDIIGRDRTAINRGIDPDTKSGELALLFVRCYRALHALFGGDAENMKYWFSTMNRHLNGRPKELVRSVQGLNTVLVYLDGMRGKI